MNSFFYITSGENARTNHRIGAIAYSFDNETKTVSFGSSVVHPSDRGTKFNPIGCKWRAIQKLRDAPVKMPFTEFRDSSPMKLLKSLDLIRFTKNYSSRNWYVNLQRLDTIGMSIIKDMDGVRHDGKLLAAAAK